MSARKIPAIYSAAALGHVWIIDEDGTPEYHEGAPIAFGYHAGPMCVNCYDSYCEHCENGPKEPCDNVPSEADPGDEAEVEFRSAC